MTSKFWEARIENREEANSLQMIRTQVGQEGDTLVLLQWAGQNPTGGNGQAVKWPGLVLSCNQRGEQ